MSETPISPAESTEDALVARRRLLKAIGATVGAVFVDQLVPAEWAPAWLHVGALPAHAACSQGADPFTDSPVDAPFRDHVRTPSPDDGEQPKLPFETRVGPGSEDLLTWTGDEDLVVRNVGDRTGELWLLFHTDTRSTGFFAISEFQLLGEGDHEPIRAVVSRFDTDSFATNEPMRELDRQTVTTEPTDPGVLFRTGGLVVRTLMIPIPASGTLRIRGAHLGACR